MQQSSAAPSIVVGSVNKERIAAQLDQLGPMPAIAAEVSQVVEDPDSSVAQLEELVARDPLITAKLFKLANSAFYARGKPSETLSHACGKLGMNSIRNVVLATCAGKTMSETTDNYAYAKFGLWQHSMALAVAASNLAPEIGVARSKRDRLFLAGMMHEVGKMILAPLLEGEVHETGAVSIARESALAGVNHMQLGVEVAEQWSLPDYVVDATRCHHTPAKTNDDEAVIASLHLFDHALNVHRVGLSDAAETGGAAAPVAMEMLGLKEGDVDDVLHLVGNQLEDIDSLTLALTT